MALHDLESGCPVAIGVTGEATDRVGGTPVVPGCWAVGQSCHFVQSQIPDGGPHTFYCIISAVSRNILYSHAGPE